MATLTEKKTAEELVKQKYPGAYVWDDGDWVYIHIPDPITQKCPTCGQKWTHRVEGLEPCIGSAGNSGAAWEDAAESLGLV